MSLVLFIVTWREKSGVRLMACLCSAAIALVKESYPWISFTKPNPTVFDDNSQNGEEGAAFNMKPVCALIQQRNSTRDSAHFPSCFSATTRVLQTPSDASMRRC